MAELVDASEERTVTWPEKWAARYFAMGYALGYAEGYAERFAERRALGVERGRVQNRVDTIHAMLGSLEEAVRKRFGAAVAQPYELKLGTARQALAALDLEFVDDVCQCVMLSDTPEQLLAGLRSMRNEIG